MTIQTDTEPINNNNKHHHHHHHHTDHNDRNSLRSVVVLSDEEGISDTTVMNTDNPTDNPSNIKTTGSHNDSHHDNKKGKRKSSKKTKKRSSKKHYEHERTIPSSTDITDAVDGEKKSTRSSNDLEIQLSSTSTTVNSHDSNSLIGHSTSSKQNFPSIFLCPGTHTLMTDPVVGQDGVSYQKSYIVANDGEKKSLSSTCMQYYPNRALQAIIQERLSSEDESIRSSIRNLQQSVSRGLSHILPSSEASETFFRPLEDTFYCPITFSLMHDPVIDPEGNTFERVAVENWIRINKNSPITRADLRLDQLYPNSAIRELLEIEKQKPEELMHPSVRKWKDEPVPMATDVELGGGAIVEDEQQQQQQQQGGGGPSVVIITSINGGQVNYPTTPSQWNAREERRRRVVYQCVGMLFAMVCLASFVLYGSLFFLMLFTMTVLIIFSKRNSGR